MKIKKNIITLSAAEFAQKVLQVAGKQHAVWEVHLKLIISWPSHVMQSGRWKSTLKTT